jgi:hypothetical protein
MKAPELFNEPRLIDINSTPWDVIDSLPEFILKKMYSSEEFELRKNAERELGGKNVKTSGQKRRDGYRVSNGRNQPGRHSLAIVSEIYEKRRLLGRRFRFGAGWYDAIEPILLFGEA